MPEVPPFLSTEARLFLNIGFPILIREETRGNLILGVGLWLFTVALEVLLCEEARTKIKER